jgi:hypothetical protein
MGSYDREHDRVSRAPDHIGEPALGDPRDSVFLDVVSDGQQNPDSAAPRAKSYKIDRSQFLTSIICGDSLIVWIAASAAIRVVPAPAEAVPVLVAALRAIPIRVSVVLSPIYWGMLDHRPPMPYRH